MGRVFPSKKDEDSPSRQDETVKTTRGPAGKTSATRDPVPAPTANQKCAMISISTFAPLGSAET